MNSFDFLRKFYKSSTSAVIVCNITKAEYWFNNIENIGLVEDDITNDGGAELFGKPMNQLSEGEYILNLHGNDYVYTVKTMADRASDFVIIEIRVESLNSAFVNSIDVANIFVENDTTIKSNSWAILSLLEKTVDNRPITQDEYQAIQECTHQMICSNRTLANIVEISKDCKDIKRSKNNLSDFAMQFVDNCQPVLKSKNIDIELNCIEDIYGKIGQVSFNNLCTSILNRLICVCDGYVDKFTLSLDMITDTTVDVCIFTSSTTNTLRIRDREYLIERLNKKDALGTDLFNIKHFCQSYGAEASQKIQATGHSVTISVRIPNCSSNGLMLFRSNTSVGGLDKKSNAYISLSECVSYFDAE